MVGVRLPDDQRQRSSAALLADATGGLAALDHCVELSCCAGDFGDKRVAYMSASCVAATSATIAR
jgi:hypothetical protein